MEHDVAEAQHGNVLDEFLTEVVIDAIGVLLREILRQSLRELRDESRSLPKGFSTITRVWPDLDETCLDAFCATGMKIDGGMER